MIANIKRNLALKESLDCGGCPTAQNELAAGSVCYKCFCQRSSNVVSQRSFCPEEFNRYVWRIVMSFVAPLSNVVSNVVLRKLMVVLTLYEKHGTLSYEQTSLAMKIFLVQFLNTGVSPVIANAKISELDTVSRKGNVELFLYSGQFPDFLPGWYQDVGKSLAYFLAIQVVSRSAAALFTRVVLPLVKRKLSRKFIITQRQMNKMREGPDFELAIRYGELLNIIFIAVFYSTCMPLLLAFAALGFFLQFWTEKYELLRSSKKPATYSADLALISMQVLPLSWGTSAWEYGPYLACRTSPATTLFLSHAPCSTSRASRTRRRRLTAPCRRTPSSTPTFSCFPSFSSRPDCATSSSSAR